MQTFSKIIGLIYVFCFVFVVSYLISLLISSAILLPPFWSFSIEITSSHIICGCLIFSYIISVLYFLFSGYKANLSNKNIILTAMMLTIFGFVTFGYFLLKIDFLKNFFITLAILFILIMFLPIFIGIILLFIHMKHQWLQYLECTIPYKSMEEYTQLLNDYMSIHQFVDMLQNSSLQIYFNDYGSGNIIRILNKKNNKLYELYTKTRSNGNETLITVWGIIQMYFNEKITFEGLKHWSKFIDNIKLKQIR